MLPRGEREIVLGDGSLSFREFVTRETPNLAAIQDTILDFLRDRDDAVLFGALAVNAHVDEPRMTEDVDLLSPRAGGLAEEIRDHLAERFTLAVGVREGEAKGSYRVFQLREPKTRRPMRPSFQAQPACYRVFQLREPKTRHLVDLRTVTRAPKANRIGGLLVLSPDELVARKVIAYTMRRGQPKAGTDWRDIATLLLRFPELKSCTGTVADRLAELMAPSSVNRAWAEIVERPIEPETDDW